jgi:membrane protease subunit (stomatin/prohibitin family)
MAVTKLVQFSGSSDILAWKFPETELATSTKLVVHETQEAILFKGGQALDLFGPGRHTLSTKNTPLLQSIIHLPFGGQTPFTAEVWFINKANSVDVKWGTIAPLQLQDPRYQVILPVRAYGQFGVQIEDSRKFLLKLIGTMPVFNVDALRKYFRGLLMMNFHEIITSYLVYKKISILEINMYNSEIASHIEERIRPVFKDFGMKVFNFCVESINTPEDDPAAIRLKEALAKKAEMNIIGYNYQQEQTFNASEEAAATEGTGSDSGNRTEGIAPVPGTGIYDKKCPRCGTNNRQEANFCINCGHQYAILNRNLTSCNACGNLFPSIAKFCPHCGDPYSPCPKCGTDNAGNALLCRNCGYSLYVDACLACGEQVDPSGKFCMHCGTQLSPSVARCDQCQQEIKPGQPYCHSCGNKLGDREE